MNEPHHPSTRARKKINRASNFSFSFAQCVVPENIHTHPKEGSWKFQGGRGFQKPNFLKESVALKWNFQRGWGVQAKNLPREGYGHFLEQHNGQEIRQVICQLNH